MRQIFRTREESKERPALSGDVLADCPLQHRISQLQRVQHRSLRDRALDLEVHLTVDVRQRSEMPRQPHPNHSSVWTSTERTAGRSRTIGAQLSPASDETYTCPPVVPKYTPHLSSESTAIASRSTLT